MKRNCYYFLLTLLFFVLSFSFLFASAVVKDFKAEPGTNKVTLKWTTLSEVDCQEFVVERSLDKESFEEKGKVKAAGNSSEPQHYEFHDNSVFRSAANTFYYRLKIIHGSGSEQILPEIIAVTPSISGIMRHTWGSIKAMFR